MDHENDRWLRGFDGVRAIACILVIGHHLYQKLGLPSVIQGIMDYGGIGVCVFFVLSGCLLTYPYAHAFYQGSGYPSLKTYFLRRFARIAPAYYVVVVVGLICSLFLTDTAYLVERFFAALIFISPYHYITFFPNDLNLPLWSIGLEVGCYAILPIVMYGIWCFCKSRFVAIVLGVFIAIGVLQVLYYVIINTITIDPGNGWSDGPIGGAKLWLPYWNLASFMGQFLCGSLAAVMIVYIRNSATRVPGFLFDVFAVSLIVVNVVLIGILLPNPGGVSEFNHQPYAAPIVSLLIALILVCLNYSNWLYRLFDNIIFRKIALYSYGIYLWHMLVMEIMRIVWVPDYVWHGIQDYTFWVLLSVGVCVVTLGLSIMSFHWVEKPVLRYAKKLSSSS